MKIITWNCNGALRKKTEFLDQLDADVLVVQECEDPSKSTKKYHQWSGNYLWRGLNKNRGIGIFVKKQHQVEELKWSGEFSPRNDKTHVFTTEQLELFIPCIINGKLPQLGIWTKQANSRAFPYIGQLWLFLQIHKEQFNNNNQIICGDFNSNSAWDSWDRWWNHSDVVKELQEIGLQSLYHVQNRETQGEESEATFYMYRNPEKRYHIDYAFVAEQLLDVSSVKILDARFWIELSDHVPLEITISD